MMRQLGGISADKLSPILKFSALRGVGKLLVLGSRGAQGDAPRPGGCGSGVRPPQVAVPDAAMPLKYVRPSVRGVRHNDFREGIQPHPHAGGG